MKLFTHLFFCSCLALAFSTPPFKLRFELVKGGKEDSYQSGVFSAATFEKEIDALFNWSKEKFNFNLMWDVELPKLWSKFLEDPDTTRVVEIRHEAESQDYIKMKLLPAKI